MIWPRHEGKPEQAEAILRKAFVDAGAPQKLVDGIVGLEWRSVGFRAGVTLAGHYERPEKLNGHRSHVRVVFPQAISGPLAVGSGRYRGLGLFAAEFG